MSHITVIPAYGRDYKSKKEILADWVSHKDFQCVGFHGEGYVCDTDITNSDINVRYARQTKVAVLTRKKSGEWTVR